MSRDTFTLVAEAEPTAKRTEPFLQKAEDWISVGLLIGILLAGAVVILIVDRWRRGAATGVARDLGQLTDYREMFERGEITAEEYERLRAKVSERVKPAPARPVEPPPPPNPVVPPETPGRDSPA